jgi:hypothetical protein
MSSQSGWPLPASSLQSLRLTKKTVLSMELGLIIRSDSLFLSWLPSRPKLRPDVPKPTAGVSTSQHDKALETATHSHSQNKKNSSSANDSEEEGSSSNNEDDEEVELKKSTVRVSWEWGHRIVGLILVGLAWVNCHTGIDWFLFNWQDEAAESLTGVFSGVTAGISGLIIVVSVGLRLVK